MGKSRGLGLCGLIVFMGLFTASAQACYSPTQYAVIDSIANSLNMSNASLRMVFETACGNYTVINNTINYSYYNVSNTTYVFNYTDMMNAARESARNESASIIQNYTSWVDEKLRMTRLLDSLVILANSTNKIEGIDGMVLQLKKELEAGNEEWQDEITKTFSGYVTEGKMAEMNVSMLRLQGDIERIRFDMSQRPWYYDWWWVFPIAAALAFVAYKKGLLGSSSGHKDAEREAFISALRGMGYGNQGAKRHISSIDEAAGEDGKIDFKTELSKADSIKKTQGDYNSRRLKAAAAAMEEARKKASRGD